jgi:hypothetical protein
MMSKSGVFHLAMPLLLTGEFRPDEGFAFTFVLGAELHASQVRLPELKWLISLNSGFRSQTTKRAW